MEHIELTRMVDEGEYDAILREMTVWPTRFDRGQNGWYKFGDRPVARIDLYFEVLDGAPEPQSRSDWLSYTEHWAEDQSPARTDEEFSERAPSYDRMVREVEDITGQTTDGGRLRCITTLPVGHRFRVCVCKGIQVGSDEVMVYCQIAEVLGLSARFESK
jgi:hypothetical protein